MLNLLFGWTVVGWIIAMLWATSKEITIEHQVLSHIRLFDEIEQLKHFYEKGLVSEGEFNKEKSKLLRHFD